MSPTFSTRPYRTNPRLAKDSPLNFHPPPPSKTTTGPLSSCLLKKETRKTPFGGRVVLTIWLPALCLLPFQLDHAGQTQDLPKIHLSTSTPPLQNNHGSVVILSSQKRNQKNTIWRKGSSHYLTTCTMSPAFSTRPCRTNPRLAKDSPLNFHPPPSKTTTGPLSSCLLKKETRKTPFGGRVVLTIWLPPLCLLPFQLDHTGQTQDLPKLHLSTSTPPLQNNHGSVVILSSQKRNQKTPFFICLHWSMQEKSKTCQRFTSCTFLSMEYVDPY